VSDPAALLAFGSALTLSVGVTSIAALKAWHEWLDLKRARLESPGGRGSSRARELAELRERVKRLEAIANG
jgi:hypothetical protein